jgi:opacity protein-like surface antigen
MQQATRTPAASFITALAAAVVCGAAMAQEPVPLDETPSRWTLEAHPGIWYVGMSGDLTLPGAAGGGRAVDTSDALGLEDPRVSPFAEATLRRGNWLVSMRGFVYSNDQEVSAGSEGALGDVTWSEGDRLSSSLDIWGMEGLVGYTMVDHSRNPLESGGHALRFRLDALAGVRVLEVDAKVGVVSAAASSGDELAVHPLIGARFTTDFHNDFSVIVELSGGGMAWSDDSSYGLDIVVGGQWRPVPNVGVQVGYRAIFMGVESGEGDDAFEFSGSGQGLYGGVTFAF